MTRALRSRCSSFLLAVLLLATGGGATLAQDATTQARIDYETAKLALEQGKPEVALEKLRAVRAVLGDLPELLVFSAQAFFDTGDPDEAKKLLGQALSSKDPEFQKGKAFETAVKLSAKIQLGAATADKSFEELGLGNWAEHRDRRRVQMGPCFHEYNGLEVGAKWRTRERFVETGSSGSTSVREISVGAGGLQTIVFDGKSSTFPCSPETMPKELKSGVNWTRTNAFGLDETNRVAGMEKITLFGKAVEALLILTDKHGRNSSGTEISSSSKTWLVRGVGLVRFISSDNGISVSSEMLEYSVPK